MQVIINIPDQDYVDYWENRDFDEITDTFSTKELFCEELLPLMEDMIPSYSCISVTGFEDFKEKLKTRLRRNYMEELENKLKW